MRAEPRLGDPCRGVRLLFQAISFHLESKPTVFILRSNRANKRNLARGTSLQPTMRNHSSGTCAATKCKWLAPTFTPRFATRIHSSLPVPVPLQMNPDKLSGSANLQSAGIHAERQHPKGPCSCRCRTWLREPTARRWRALEVTQFRSYPTRYERNRSTRRRRQGLRRMMVNKLLYGRRPVKSLFRRARPAWSRPGFGYMKGWFGDARVARKLLRPWSKSA